MSKELEKALELLREIRPSIPKDVLKLWCKDRDDFLASQQGEQCDCIGCEAEREDSQREQHPEQAEGAQGERERFEDWFLRKFYEGDKQCGLEWLSTEPCGGYRHKQPAELWEVWQARAALAQPSPAPELERPEVVGYACLDDIQWGGDITLRPEKSEHYSVPFAPVAQAGQVSGHAAFLDWAEKTLKAEQKRLDDEGGGYLMDTGDCIDTLREAAAPAQGGE